MRLFAIIACLMAALTGCARHTLPDQRAPASVANFSEGYRLEPGNRVRVIIFNESNLSGEFQLDASGNLSMPLVGSVRAAGVTAKELGSRIVEVLKKNNYLRDPSIAVEVVTYRPFYVLGEVKLPGEFSYTAGMTVLSAVARAGGYDYRAREGEVILIRIEDGVERQYRAQEITPILPGDIVRVVERFF